MRRTLCRTAVVAAISAPIGGLALKLPYVRRWQTRQLWRRRHTLSALVALEDTKRLQPAEILRYLADRHNQEQNFFWHRFAPFLAANVVAFGVISQKTLAHPLSLAIGGTGLAAFWLYIQWKSLEYVDLAKEPYFAYLQHLGFPWHHEPYTLESADPPPPNDPAPANPVKDVLGSWSTADRLTALLHNALNSTRIAVAVCAGVLVVWMCWLFSILWAGA